MKIQNLNFKNACATRGAVTSCQMENILVGVKSFVERTIGDGLITIQYKIQYNTVTDKKYQTSYSH